MKHFPALPHLAVLCLLCLLAGVSPIVLAQAAQEAADEPAAPADAEGRKLDLDLDEKVLVFTKPVREDGTIDYIAALNNKYSEGVTNENNAYRALYLLMPVEDEWEDQADFHTAMREMLKITDAEIEQAPRFVAWVDFAAQRGHDRDAANEIEDAFDDDVFSAKAHPDYLAWLEANEPVFVAAGRAVARSSYYAPLIAGDETGLLIYTLLPQLGNYRMLARGLQDRAFRAAATGDEAKVLDSLQTVSRLALHQSQETFLISGLVAISIDALNVETIRQLLVGQSLSDKKLAQIDTMLRDRPSRVTLAQTVIEGERCYALDAYMQIMAGRFDEDEIITDELTVFNRNRMPQSMIDVGRGLKIISRQFEVQARIMRVNSFAGRQRVQQIFEDQFEIAVLREQYLVDLGDFRLPKLLLLTVEGRTDAITGAYLGMTLSGFGASANTETRYTATERNMLAAIACERYRLEHDKLPQKLDDLVPAYIDAVPTDPFNDEPVRYKQTDNGFVVYSVGQNLQDDGGVENREDRDQGDWVFEIVWDKD